MEAHLHGKHPHPKCPTKSDALLSSLLDPLEGLGVLNYESWNLEPLPTSSTEGGKRGMLEILGLN